MPKSRRVKRPSQEKPAVELTQAEWEIMKVVWKKEPCAAGTVQESLAKSRNRAYSTVKTTMDRMTEKGFLQIEKIRNLQLFRSCISEVDAKRGEFRKMLKRAFDGALTPMMQ
ncbi:MAG: BlaI/MecI/CopY family transcriptional regulator, partial [Thermoplasmata archaeon]